jgi:ABC-type sugar transport system ATPase subunit
MRAGAGQAGSREVVPEPQPEAADAEGLRPEHFTAAAPGPAEDQAVITIRVEVVETLGPVNYVHFTLPNLAGQDRVPWVASLDPAIPAAPEQKLELAFDSYRIHCFDPETGTAL